MAKTITVKQKDLKHNLSEYPNFASSGSITGMKKLVYGKDAKLIKCGSYIYNVPSEIYEAYT